MPRVSTTVKPTIVRGDIPWLRNTNIYRIRYKYLLTDKTEKLAATQHSDGSPIFGSGYTNYASVEAEVANCGVLIVGSGYGGAIAANLITSFVGFLRW